MPQNIWASLSLSGEVFLQPSKRIHKTLFSENTSNSSSKKIVFALIDIVAQTILSPLSAFGFFLKTTSIPYIIRRNEKKKKEMLRSLAAKIDLLIREEGPVHAGRINSSRLMYKGIIANTRSIRSALIQETARRQEASYEIIKKSFIQTINNSLTWKFIRIAEVAILVDYPIINKNQEKMAKIELMIIHS